MMTVTTVQLNVNGREVQADVEPHTLLVEMLRGPLGLTGSHVACDTSQCGCCSVMLDGDAIKSCTMLAVQAQGRRVTTIEGLAGPGGELHPVQQAFVDCHGLQCGFCTPGMIVTATCLLRKNPQPSEAEIEKALEGNLCRCTGYVNIVKSVQAASKAIAEGAQA
jgi:carbon-monoxide dehydrogenase small subunit